MRRIVVFIILNVFFLILFLGSYRLTDGFKEGKIVAMLPRETEIAYLSYVQLPLNIQKVLSQPFYYLGKGRQAYVFESQDKRFVVKFIRTHKYIKPFWSKHVPVLSTIKKMVLQEKKERKERSLLSYYLASELLAEETGVIFSSFSYKKKIDGTITVFDRGKRLFHIDLGCVHFILQKKAVSLDSYLQKQYEKKDKKTLEKVVTSYFSYLASRAEKEVWNRDYKNAMRNMGWVDGQVIECDIGSFYLNDPATTYEEEINRYKQVLLLFLKDNKLDLVVDVEKIVDGVCYQ